MDPSLLSTKLFIPKSQKDLVPRPRLFEKLNKGQDKKLTLISAPAGFGKSTLLSNWVRQSEEDIVWVSLDESDNDPTMFLTYLIAALNQSDAIETAIGKGSLSLLQSPQSPPVVDIMTSLINEITSLLGKITLVLDDYHLIQEPLIDESLTFLIGHQPQNLHLIIATRDDPQLPLVRLRAKGQMNELRAADLRFSLSETTEFLNQVMGLSLSVADITALETRTKGWIVGLQLAAISLQGQEDTTCFIKSFTGSHRFILDYLIEEVLEKQTKDIQKFLLKTSILDRMTGSLCDALTAQNNSQKILKYLEQANLFIVPLDNERRWYRYHHLFADLLREQLHQSDTSSTGDESGDVAELHLRASVWYEDNGLEIEAFQHAVAANDIERAERLIEGDGMPLHYRGAVAPVLNWIRSLPTTVLDARPSLWVAYASALVFIGQPTGVEEKLQAAEAALQDADPDDKNQDLLGRIAAMWAALAVPQNQIEIIITQSLQALNLLHPDNLPVRTAATWTLAYAYQLQGDYFAAKQTYTKVISFGQASGNIMFTIAGTRGLGNVQETENQLYLAAETYRRVLQLVGDQPLSAACEAHLGLARIFYEWNDVDSAQKHGQQSVKLAQKVSFVACEVFLARLKLAQGDVTGAAEILTTADQFVHQHNFMYQMPEVAAEIVITLLHQGNLAAASQLVEKYELPISQARVHLAQGETSAALAVLEPMRQQVEAKGLKNEWLKVMILQAVAHHAHGEKDKAVQLLGDALVLGETGGFIRIFVDEGPPMARLLYEVLSRGISPDYVQRLLAAFPDVQLEKTDLSISQAPKSKLLEPLSEREIEVLELIAEGLTNRDIATRLYLSLHTVKVHAHNIYAKLGVKNRTQAAAKGKTLGILSPN